MSNRRIIQARLANPRDDGGVGQPCGVSRKNQVSSFQLIEKETNVDSLLFILLIGLAGGVAIGLQSPMASLITQRLGLFESVFIVHLGGAVIALIPLLILGSKLTHWKSLPWYTLGAGFFGLVVIGSISFMIPRIGVAAAITTIIAGQLLVGTILDHYGLLGATVKSLDGTRAFGLLVVLAGVWLTVK